jgi:hypothetical protein
MRIWGLSIILATIYGCQSKVDVSQPTPQPLKLKTILVLPFEDMSVGHGENLNARCPVCERVFITGEVEDAGDSFLTNQLIVWLQKNSNYEIAVLPISLDSQALLYSSNETAGLVNRKIADLGRRHNADAVLIGFLYRFKERVGKGYSIESPASVAFGMHLIRVSDQRTVWSANYEETQRSLGENVLLLGQFLKRGGRWVTAEEMARAGLEKILKKFPMS